VVPSRPSRIRKAFFRINFLLHGNTALLRCDSPAPEGMGPAAESAADTDCCRPSGAIFRTYYAHNHECRNSDEKHKFIK